MFRDFFCTWLTIPEQIWPINSAGMIVVPLTFNTGPYTDLHVIRVCYAMYEETSELWRSSSGERLVPAPSETPSGWRIGWKSCEMTNNFRNNNNLNLKIFQSILNWRGADIKFNSSMNMKIMILFVVKILAFKISSINEWRQFSLCLDLVISKKWKQNFV